MTGPHPATAAIRYAVRACLADLPPGAMVLVACSGGADSLALAAAVAFEAPKSGLVAGAIIVDHGLQEGSLEIAKSAAQCCRALGLGPVELVPARVEGTPAGLEADARTARYDALEEAAARLNARAVLLGHTLDDQAEQVLLGLARGSGARSLSGMPPARGRFRRPLLGVTRDQTKASCRAEGLTWWADPMNENPRFARVRARSALRQLEADLGPGLSAALARSADQLRADADYLDALADDAARDLGDGPYEVASLTAYGRPVRTRVWRRLLIAHGAPGGQLGSRHTDACDGLLTDWRGQGPLHLPGNLRVAREGTLVSITSGSQVQ